MLRLTLDAHVRKATVALAILSLRNVCNKPKHIFIKLFNWLLHHKMPLLGQPSSPWLWRRLAQRGQESGFPSFPSDAFSAF